MYIGVQKKFLFIATHDELAAAFQKLVDDYVSTKYPRKTAEALSR